MKLIKQFIAKRPAEKRLTYFYAMAATDEQVWLLRDQTDGEFLLLEGERGYRFTLPVWPSRSFAELELAKLENHSFEAINVPLTKFLDDLLVTIERDQGVAVIFPNGVDSIVQTRGEMKEMFRNL